MYSEYGDFLNPTPSMNNNIVIKKATPSNLNHVHTFMTLRRVFHEPVSCNAGNAPSYGKAQKLRLLVLVRQRGLSSPERVSNSLNPKTQEFNTLL